MTDKPVVPSPLQMLARVNEALEASGLAAPDTQREPLPLFRELFLEWSVCQHPDAAELGDEVLIVRLLQDSSSVELQAVLRSIFNEAIQLSNAHGTLTIWTRRELDQELRRWQNLIEHEQLRRDTSLGSC